MNISLTNDYTVRHHSHSLEQLLDTFRETTRPLTLKKIQALYPDLPKRTLQRWLHRLVKLGLIVRQGNTKGSRYILVEDPSNTGVFITSTTSFSIHNRVMRLVISHPERPIEKSIDALLSPRVKSIYRKNIKKLIEEDIATLSPEKLKKYYRLNDKELEYWESYQNKAEV
ncbi:hypothetical protein M3P05_14185 [Sansalvadorimonas sp. 2012CJ34-2]|uniref:Uncharacterized protein n=1 Tax=Parendozoicomonas callyspongiae TaxID=2942213 RepID=A0ABT0PI76_9GAMM|nr:hypothetical protein [Sansalvadorimonas sp. 2012CJ34-2]MCL6271074.1 hypothetical protein [Sansalvadorimonas sp. 2012CJ34-2]